MSTHLDLYWLIPKGYFVASPLVPTRIALPAFHRQDRQAIRLHLLDVDPATRGTIVQRDLAGYECVIGVGDPLTAEALAENNATMSWDAGTMAFAGILNLYTTEMEAALAAATGQPGIDQSFYFRVQQGAGATDERLAGLADCRVLEVIKLVASGLPEDITASQFADLLTGASENSDTVAVARTVNNFKWHVRRKSAGGVYADADGLFVRPVGAAPAILPDLAAGFTVGMGFAASPTTGSDVVTVGGVTGALYRITARVVETVETKNHSGGTQAPGDDAHIYRGGTPAGDDRNLWYLDISNPPQRIHLNHDGGAVATITDNLLVDFLAYAGATVTLLFDTIDGLSLAANSALVTQEMAVEAVPDVRGRETVWLPAGALTPRITDGPVVGSAETASNQVMQPTLDFDPDTAQFAQFEVAMPKSWDRGNVAAEFLWQTAGGGGDVVWGIQAVAVGNGEALDATFGTAQKVTDSVIAADALLVSAETGEVVIGGSPDEHDLVVFQVFRAADDGDDTLAATAKLKGVRLFYRTDAPNDN